MNDIQSVILDIFSSIQKICKKHNITYYAIGGTCIGAVRHKGFIPWDDDLDIAIPIQDFDRFLNIAEKELPNYLKVYRCENIIHYRYIFAKIHNVNTTFIEHADADYPDAQKGIWVDIMPISSIPSDAKKQKRFYRNLNWYLIMNYIRRYPLHEMVSWKKKLMWLVIRPLCLFTNYTYFSKKWLDMLRENPLGSSELTGYTWWNHRSNLTFPMSAFNDTIEVPFEDITISCPIDFDTYLTIQFGDYMKIPPKEEQQQHHVEYVNVKTSYKLYNGGK